jgi:hypothetical protein|tara:strand:- start:59 stop:385 length:327 start_codon:yes stop_codon:yes gene_type:complete
MKINEFATASKYLPEAKVEMCPEACCGKPILECKCGPDCEHCDCYAKNKETVNEDGVIVQGVNTTVDVKPGQTEIEAAKFGNGKVQSLMPKRGKDQKINTLYNMGLAK